MHCSINYNIKKEEEASISINERGFLFGDGVFETCLIENGVIYNFLSHLKRLKSGLESIKIDFELDNILENCQKLIAKNSTKSGLIRIYISRGQGSTGYLPTSNKPLIIIQIKNLPQEPNFPIELCLSKNIKISPKSLPINYKLAQGLNSTLAKIEAQENGCFDAILLNEEQKICETSSANIFWIKDDILFTPHKDCGILLGTIRQKILKLSPIPNKEISANFDEILKADEVFISNVSYKILPVERISQNPKIYKNTKYFPIFKQKLSDDIINFCHFSNSAKSGF